MYRGGSADALRLVADVDRTRLKLATEMGADEILLASGSEMVEQVLKLTGGRGVDLVLEAVGRDETVSAAVDAEIAAEK